ncbi:hypothetical protein J6590_004490 [Homalodisca vitripennis]|nr:hypothetical protein J6590_004490 [Homalodisca vitripennis]
MLINMLNSSSGGESFPSYRTFKKYLADLHIASLCFRALSATIKVVHREDGRTLSTKRADAEPLSALGRLGCHVSVSHVPMPC